MYEEYFYQSSVNNTMRNHLLGVVNRILTHYGPSQPSRWLDIGCNDGYLCPLSGLWDGVPFGVDPSDILGRYLKMFTHWLISIISQNLSIASFLTLKKERWLF